MTEPKKKVTKRRLSQIVGADSTMRTQTKTDLTRLHRISAKPDLFNGFEKTYKAFDEDDNDKPDLETRKVQQTANRIFEELRTLMSPLYDVTLTKDCGNGAVKADIKIGDTVIAKDVHVPTLLWLKDRLDDLHKFVDSMPVLDPAQHWEFDQNAGYFKSSKTETVRKVLRDTVVQLAEATEHHAEQAQLVKEEKAVGTYTSVKQSGALHGKTKRDILLRIQTLRLAVIEAREGANAERVDDRELGTAVFEYILKPLEATT